MIYYAAITILLAFVDWYRIKIQNAKNVKNNTKDDINHAISTALCIIAAAGLYLLINGLYFDWHVITYIFGCVGVRLLVFDISLNLMRREKIDYISNSSTSQEEQRFTHVSFFERRLIGFVILAACIAANYFIK